jgi:hypothetical protein
MHHHHHHTRYRYNNIIELESSISTMAQYQSNRSGHTVEAEISMAEEARMHYGDRVHSDPSNAPYSVPGNTHPANPYSAPRNSHPTTPYIPPYVLAGSGIKTVEYDERAEFAHDTRSLPSAGHFNSGRAAVAEMPALIQRKSATLVNDQLEYLK